MAYHGYFERGGGKHEWQCGEAAFGKDESGFFLREDFFRRPFSRGKHARDGEVVAHPRGRERADEFYAGHSVKIQPRALCRARFRAVPLFAAVDRLDVQPGKRGEQSKIGIDVSARAAARKQNFFHISPFAGGRGGSAPPPRSHSMRKTIFSLHFADSYANIYLAISFTPNCVRI